LKIVGVPIIWSYTLGELTNAIFIEFNRTYLILNFMSNILRVYTLIYTMELLPWERHWQETRDEGFMREVPNEENHPVRIRMGNEAARVGGKILDMGCGTAIDYPRISKAGEYYGIEPIPRFIEAAKKRYPEINIQQGRIWNIDYPNKYFDVTWCKGVVQHLPPGTYPEGLEELWRVTKTLMMVSTNRIWTDVNMSHREKGGPYDNHYNFNEFHDEVCSLPRSVSKCIKGLRWEGEEDFLKTGYGIHTLFIVYDYDYWRENFGE
jgi:SAM-dependent methyltransferase